MASIYSRRFIATTGGTPASYTVPDGQVALIRGLTAVNTLSTTAYINLQLVASGLYIASVVLAAASQTPGNNGVTIDMRVVLSAGEQIRMTALGGGVHGTVSGYLFAA